MISLLYACAFCHLWRSVIMIMIIILAKIDLFRQCATNQYLRKKDEPHRYCQEACANITKCGPVVVPEQHLQVSHLLHQRISLHCACFDYSVVCMFGLTRISSRMMNVKLHLILLRILLRLRLLRLQLTGRNFIHVLPSHSVTAQSTTVPPPD